MRRKPTATFNFGLGRVESLVGMPIVVIILISALMAGYEAIDGLIHLSPLRNSWQSPWRVIGFNYTFKAADVQITLSAGNHLITT